MRSTSPGRTSNGVLNGRHPRPDLLPHAHHCLIAITELKEGTDNCDSKRQRHGHAQSRRDRSRTSSRRRSERLLRSWHGALPAQRRRKFSPISTQDAYQILQPDRLTGRFPRSLQSKPPCLKRDFSAYGISSLIESVEPLESFQ